MVMRTPSVPHGTTEAEDRHSNFYETRVNLAVPPLSLCSYHHLWPIFVAQVGGWDSPWHEFSVNQSVPPDHVLELIHDGDDRWPASIAGLRAD